MTTFQQIGLTDKTIKLLGERGITVPTAVQQAVIPAILSRAHTAFQSETGTGKTLAYLLPLEQMRDKSTALPTVIIAAPTNELASQIKTETQNFTEAKAVLCIGGVLLKRQTELLKEKPAVIIGSPARILELIYLKKLKTAAVSAVVLDEADRLLSKELRDETTALLKEAAKGRQNSASIQIIACSATLKDSCISMLEKHLPQTRQPADSAAENTAAEESKSGGNECSGAAFAKIILPPENILRENISHWAVFSEQRDKIETLRKFIAAEKPEKMLVFAARPEQAELIVSHLRRKKIDCLALHSKSRAQERQQTLNRFRSGSCRILVTSDLASRGLDIPRISHVVQMDMPQNEDFFIHRAGRTARAGARGVNLVIGTAYELRRLAAFEKNLHLIVYPKALRGGQVITPGTD